MVTSLETARSPPWSSRRPLTQQHDEAVSGSGSRMGAAARRQVRGRAARNASALAGAIRPCSALVRVDRVELD